MITMEKRISSGKQRKDNNMDNNLSFNEFFKNLSEDEFIIISKFDEIGNWAVFICNRINDKKVCRGHMGLCYNNGKSKFSVADVLELLSFFRNQGTEVIIDAEWFLMS